MTPLDKERIKAIPIIPILPAKATSSVLVFFVRKLLKLNDKEVSNDILALPIFLDTFSDSSSSTVYGLLSERIVPSFSTTILVAYSFASSGLCVTITTSLSFATSFNKSITWTLVSESKAPVGSSAKTISGSFTNALAIATRCICPPDIWLGFLCSCPFKPTFSNAAIAFSFLSLRETPEIVNASSTLDNTVWWGIKL